MPIMNALVQLRVPAHASFSPDVNHGQAGKERAHRCDARHHADSESPQAVFAGKEIVRTATVSIVASTITATMRNFARTSASELGLFFFFNVFDNRRHN